MKNATIISMWVSIILLVVVVGYAIVEWRRIKPEDVLQATQRNTELIKSLTEKMNSRFYYESQTPNIWELIDANDLKVPEGWER